MTDLKRKNTVTYIYDEKVATFSNKITPIPNRAKLVHGLIHEAYKLTEHMKWIPSVKATFDDLKVFHSTAYVDFLAACDERDENNYIKKYNNTSFEDEDTEDDEFEVSYENEHKLTTADFGFGYDCPIFKDMGKFCCQIAGASLTACDALINGDLRAINWMGGWHHSGSQEAKGFCIVNDVVLSILRLKKAFPQIFYIDLDAHHGDGVENAFSATKNIMTMSMHIHEPGYFPGSGDVTDIGIGPGKYYAVNVPLKSGVTDAEFCNVFKEVLQCVKQVFFANAIVVQCGADCLAGDKLGLGNLTEKGLGTCVSEVLKMQLPTLFLGGGGYNVENTAKCWAYITSLITEQTISTEIPDHSNFLSFGPDYELSVTPSLRRSENSTKYLESVLHQIKENLERLNQTKNDQQCLKFFKAL